MSTARRRKRKSGTSRTRIPQYMGGSLIIQIFVIMRLHANRNYRALPQLHGNYHCQLLSLLLTNLCACTCGGPKRPASHSGKSARKPPTPRKPRRLVILRRDLDEHGFIVGCRMCDHLRVYGQRRSGDCAHSEACRDRMTE